MMATRTFATAAVALTPALASAAEGGPWASPGEASFGYWVVAFVVVIALGLFAFWALYGKHDEPHNDTGRYHALGALVIGMTLFTLVLYVAVARHAGQTPATERAWDWRPGEELQDPAGSDLSGEPYRGYQVYLANGCTYCHTLYVRPQDVPTGFAPGATEEDVTRVGDAVNYPFTLLGTQRNGPDLTIIGKRIADMQYHIDHLVDPRRFKPQSIMPAYDYLSDRDLRDLAAYMVSLGNPPQALREGTAMAAQDEQQDGDPMVAQGEKLFRQQGCVGCHTTDGSASVGPSLRDGYGGRVTLSDGSTVESDEAYLRQSIVEPKAKLVQGFPGVMPSFEDLSQEQLDALVAFIKAQSQRE